MAGCHLAPTLGVGSPIIDLLAPVPEAFMEHVPGAKGGMELVAPEAMDAIVAQLPEPPRKAPGGSAANTVCAMARLGASVALLGKMGRDAMAQYYQEAFSAIGGSARCFKHSDEKPTARCLSLITPDGERTMRTDLGAAMLIGVDDVKPVDLDGFGHVHMEGYALFDEVFTRHVLRLAREQGCTVSLDLGSFEVVRAVSSFLPELLRDDVDMVFANEDEARAFCGADSPEVALETLGALCQCVAVKLGAKGAWIQAASERVFVPSVPVARVVDTTGAGDCWAAGFLFAHLSGCSLQESGALGALVGAETVSCLGASPDEEGWKRIARALSGC